MEVHEVTENQGFRAVERPGHGFEPRPLRHPNRLKALQMQGFSVSTPSVFYNVHTLD